MGCFILAVSSWARSNTRSWTVLSIKNLRIGRAYSLTAHSCWIFVSFVDRIESTGSFTSAACKHIAIKSGSLTSQKTFPCRTGTWISEVPTVFKRSWAYVNANSSNFVSERWAWTWSNTGFSNIVSKISLARRTKWSAKVGKIISPRIRRALC